MSRGFLPLTERPLGGPEADLARAEINRLRRALRRLVTDAQAERHPTSTSRTPRFSDAVKRAAKVLLVPPPSPSDPQAERPRGAVEWACAAAHVASREILDAVASAFDGARPALLAGRFGESERDNLCGAASSLHYAIARLYILVGHIEGGESRRVRRVRRAKGRAARSRVR